MSQLGYCSSPAATTKEGMIRSRGRPRVLVLILVVAVLAAVVALAFYHMSPERAAKRKAQREASLKQARFIAEFDSLSKARLYPTIWRAGATLSGRV